MKETLLIIDKVPGPSSFDVVREVKKLVGEKVGHTGSLDPFASGVLVLLTGKATKLSNALLNADKRYRACVQLGQSTDTMDRTGTVQESKAIPKLTFDEVDKVVKAFEGTWLQTPPMFSAKKLNGVRLYELARANTNVRRLPIPVQLYSMKTITYEEPFLQFEVHCSKGTYIRSLADELGRRLGTVAHLSELRRLSCGEFTIEESVMLEELSANLSAHMVKGYQNYVRLLRNEGLIRPRSAAPKDRHLQMNLKNGNSLLN